MEGTHVAIGGDFNRIFDHRDFLAMVSIPDEATCILRAHLILEEVLNLWSGKLTGTEDLYAGGFVPFRTKLIISRNLGLPDDLFIVLDKINEIRNRFSHKKGYVLEGSQVDALRKKVDPLVPEAKLLPCEEFHAHVGGKDAEGNQVEKIYKWGDGENRIRFVIVFVILMLKITHWMQQEFHQRGIQYTIVKMGS